MENVKAARIRERRNCRICRSNFFTSSSPVVFSAVKNAGHLRLERQELEGAEIIN